MKAIFHPMVCLTLGRALVEKPDGTVRASLSAASIDETGRGASDSIGSGLNLITQLAECGSLHCNWTLDHRVHAEPIEWQGFVGSPLAGKGMRPVKATISKQLGRHVPTLR